MEIVRRGVWNVFKLLASFAPPGKVEGVYPECWPIVTSSHHFGGKGASSSMEITNPFMKFSHDIFCILTILAF